MSKTKTKKETKNLTWHKKIAASRANNKEWNKNLTKGRLQAALTPSLLRLYRLEKRLTQEDIAKKLDVTESTYGSIELGKRMVKEETGREISNLLGKPFNFFFKASDVPKKYVAVIK